MNIAKRIFGLAVLFCVMNVGSYAHASASYNLIQLQSLGSATNVAAINNNNTIVGTSNNHAVLWYYDEGTKTWSAPQRIDTYASSIGLNLSDNNEVLFYRADTPGGSSPRVRTSTGQIINLNTTINSGYGVSYDINSSGSIVGHRGANYPTLWNITGTPTSLKLYSGNTNAWPRGINDSGIMVGNSYELVSGHGTDYHALVWTSSTATPTLLEGLAASNNGYALAINNSNVILGNSYTSTGSNHKVIWDYNGSSWDLALDINADVGEDATVKGVKLKEDGVYGFYEDASGQLNLAKWIKADTDWIRNDLYSFTDEFDMWTNVIFYGISDDGFITGSGTYNGVTTSFALTPIPEPMSIVLMLSAIACLTKRFKQK